MFLRFRLFSPDSFITLYFFTQELICQLLDVLLGFFLQFLIKAAAFDYMTELSIICKHKDFTILCLLKGIDDNVK